jgi:hypothetical protein
MSCAPLSRALGPLRLLAQNIPARDICPFSQTTGPRSDPALEFTVHELAIAIGAFHPAKLMRYLKPDARMAKGTFAPVTGHAVAIDKLCLWRLDRHLGTFPFAVNWIRSVMSDETSRGK